MQSKALHCARSTSSANARTCCCAGRATGRDDCETVQIYVCHVKPRDLQYTLQYARACSQGDDDDENGKTTAAAVVTTSASLPFACLLLGCWLLSLLVAKSTLRSLDQVRATLSLTSTDHQQTNNTTTNKPRHARTVATCAAFARAEPAFSALFELLLLQCNLAFLTHLSQGIQYTQPARRRLAVWRASLHL